MIVVLSLFGDQLAGVVTGERSGRFGSRRERKFRRFWGRHGRRFCMSSMCSALGISNKQQGLLHNGPGMCGRIRAIVPSWLRIASKVVSDLRRIDQTSLTEALTEVVLEALGGRMSVLLEMSRLYSQLQSEKTLQSRKRLMGKWRNDEIQSDQNTRQETGEFGAGCCRLLPVFTTPPYPLHRVPGWNVPSRGLTRHGSRVTIQSRNPCGWAGEYDFNLATTKKSNQQLLSQRCPFVSRSLQQTAHVGIEAP